MNSLPARPGARWKWRWIALVVGNLAIVLALAWFLLHPGLIRGNAGPGSGGRTAGASGPAVGQPAPDFTLKTFDIGEVKVGPTRAGVANHAGEIIQSPYDTSKAKTAEGFLRESIVSPIVMSKRASPPGRCIRITVRTPPSRRSPTRSPF